MTTNGMIDKFAYIKALDLFLTSAEKVLEEFINYDCENNILTRKQFNTLLKLSLAIKDADLELI